MEDKKSDDQEPHISNEQAYPRLIADQGPALNNQTNAGASVAEAAAAFDPVSPPAGAYQKLMLEWDA